MVSKGDHPQIAELFRSVKYYGLYPGIYIYSYIHMYNYFLFIFIYIYIYSISNWYIIVLLPCYYSVVMVKRPTFGFPQHGIDRAAFFSSHDLRQGISPMKCVFYAMATIGSVFLDPIILPITFPFCPILLPLYPHVFPRFWARKAWKRISGIPICSLQILISPGV